MSRYYVAGDYAGVTGGKVKFYFGYEETTGDGDDAEWCFVATEAGKETMRVPQSKLGVDAGSDMSEFLLAGIAQWLEKCK